MSTFAEDIEKAAGNESILKISVGYYSWHSDEEYERNIPAELLSKPVDWLIARPWLDYEYDDGFGGQDCHNILVWTKSFVLFVHEYDGSTSINRVPRNPSNIMPSAY